MTKTKLFSTQFFHVLACGVLLAGTASANSSTYYREHLELDKAWQLSVGSKDVKIAVISTGINYRLPNFTEKIDYDQVNKGYGYDAISENFDPLDTYGLGTEEASVIVDKDYGVAPGSMLIPIRVFDDLIGSSQVAIIKGVEYAISRKAKIIQMAISSGKPNKGLCESLRHAAQAGILVVASAGNDAKELQEKDYPTICGVENVIVIATSNSTQNLARYSSYGFRNVHTAAPGESILCVDHTASLKTGDGGSFSAALTSGVAALVWSYNPQYTALQVKEALIRGSNVASGLKGKVSSNGILSAYKAMTISLTE